MPGRYTREMIGVPVILARRATGKHGGRAWAGRLGRRAWAGGLGRAARYGGPPMVCSLSRGEFPADAITGLCQSGFGVRTAVYAQWVPSASWAALPSLFHACGSPGFHAFGEKAET